MVNQSFGRGINVLKCKCGGSMKFDFHIDGRICNRCNYTKIIKRKYYTGKVIKSIRRETYEIKKGRGL